MSNISRFVDRQGENLNLRRAVSVELPEFAIRALQHRAELANDGDPQQDDDTVTFNDVIERYEFPHLKQAVPGFTAAFTKWLFESTYLPPE